MGQKKFYRAIKAFMSSSAAPLLGDALIVILFFGLALAFGGGSFTDVIGGIFANGVAISVILVEIAVIIGNRIKKRADDNLEESEKIKDDHHAVIRQYSVHEKEPGPSAGGDGTPKNYFSATGSFLTITDVERKDTEPKRVMNDYMEEFGIEEDEFSGKYRAIRREAEQYCRNRMLRLPSLNLFTNTEGDMQLSFVDSAEEYVFPEFIIDHAKSIMEAHKTSHSNNVETIRLNDISYNREMKKLIFHTCRTNYNQMLLTNRCMDYEFATKMSIREIYEYRDKILPLSKTRMGNQIGVEGLVITSDGWTLVEKRLHTRQTTWRDKFSQPISLSLKKKDMGLKDDEIIAPFSDVAAEKLNKMIAKHLKESYELEIDTAEEKKDYSFDLKTNFLGVARDLLEGGKPNLYFYVIVRMDHRELKQQMEKRACNSEAIKTENLKRKYYLYPLEEIKIGFNYSMNMNLRNAELINRVREYDSMENRKKRNIFEKRRFYINSAKLHIRRAFHKNYRKECGEAFLSCIAFYELCKQRIEEERLAIQKNG